MRISFLNQKGGVGKTTLAVNVADAMARQGLRTLLVDADPQASAIEWASARDEHHDESTGDVLFPVVGLPSNSIHKEINAFARDYDCVIIDGPPRVNTVSASAIMASDVVFIPVQPSPYDVWAADEMVQLIDQARAIRPEILAMFVVNRKIPKTVLGKAIGDALLDYPLPVMEAEICQRVAFAESASKGQSVLDAAPTDLAAKEIKKLIKEIMELFDEQGCLISRTAA